MLKDYPQQNNCHASAYQLKIYPACSNSTFQQIVMELILHLKKNGIRYTRNAEDILYIETPHRCVESSPHNVESSHWRAESSHWRVETTQSFIETTVFCVDRKSVV